MQLDGQVGLGGECHFHARDVALDGCQHSVGVGGAGQNSGGDDVVQVHQRLHGAHALRGSNVAAAVAQPVARHSHLQQTSHHTTPTGQHSVRPAASRRECSARVVRGWCLCRRAAGRAQAPPRRRSGAAWQSTACICRGAREQLRVRQQQRATYMSHGPCTAMC